MSTTKARKWVMKNPFSGVPKREDMEIVEEELPPIKDGEFLSEALWWSVDPYMSRELVASELDFSDGQSLASIRGTRATEGDKEVRLRDWEIPVGGVMIGQQVARVTESKNKDYAVGDLVVGDFGWRTHTISDGTPGIMFPVRKIDPSITLSLSTSLGILGMPGATAYFGFLEICKPKEGETLVVTGAAGAVGSIVGQIAKIKGCRVVGFAGSDAKVAHLKSLGFDAAYNYKTMGSLEDTLKEACPKGIDMFFDNVGGEFFDTVVANMNLFGRISVCGNISQYNATEAPKAAPISHFLLMKQLRAEGFMVMRWIPEWPKAFKEIAQWIQEGKLKYEETVTEGFDRMFDAFLELFSGKSRGKAVVKAT